MTARAAYLSVVLVGRNDGFGGDFNERFFRAIRFNHERLDEAGVDHNFVFVEWAPISGRPYLIELLHQQLPGVARAVTAYVVDARYQDAFSLNPKLRFMEFVAKNVGIRRATGTFVLSTNTDIYLSRGVLDELAAGRIEAGTLYRATRADLKLGADLTHVDWGLLEDERNYARLNEIHPPLLTNGAGDFQLLDHASWSRLRGFNEVYRVAKFHIDGNFCAKAYANGYPVVDIGAPVYHLDHIGSFNVAQSIYRDRPGDAPWGRSGWNWRVIYDNPDDWGLARTPTRCIGERTQYLDYVPEAIPPLVDLRRVLAPVSRGASATVG